jgi:hypothetical protein
LNNSKIELNSWFSFYSKSPKEQDPNGEYNEYGEYDDGEDENEESNTTCKCSRPHLNM